MKFFLPEQHGIVAVHDAQHADCARDVKLEEALLALPLEKEVYDRWFYGLQPVETEHSPTKPKPVFEKHSLNE